MQLTSVITGASLATPSRKKNWLVACRFRAFMLNIAALNFGNNSALLLERHAFASNAIHDPERRPKIRGPCRTEFFNGLAEMTFCKLKRKKKKKEIPLLFVYVLLLLFFSKPKLQQHASARDNRSILFIANTHLFFT